MKDFLYSALIDPFTDGDWTGYVVGMLMWAVTIFMSVAFVCFVVWFIDSSFMPIKESEGRIINKYIVPAHNTTTFIMSGKVMIPITTHHATEWKVEIGIDGLTDKVSVDEAYYYSVSIGKSVHCHYTSGRIMDSLYIKDIS